MTNEVISRTNGPASVPFSPTRRRRSRKPRKYVLYFNAKSGMRAREEVHKILRRIGAEQVGFMDDHQAREIVLVFTQRGRPYRFSLPVDGMASMFLEQKPYSSRMRKSFDDYKKEILQQAMISASSVIRDWAKGNAAAVESRARSFEHVFAGSLLTNDGRPLAERVTEMKNLLPSPEEPKKLPGTDTD